MELKGLLEILKLNPKYQSLINRLTSIRNLDETNWSTHSSHSLIISAIWSELNRQVIVITPKPQDARQLYDQVILYLGNNRNVFLLPEHEVSPFERFSSDITTTNQRLSILASINSQTCPEPGLLITSISAAKTKTFSKESFAKSVVNLYVGQQINLSLLQATWHDLGYSRTELVETPGTYAIRGGIVDFYSPDSNLPVRIDLVSDKIENLYLFDQSSQRSVERIHSATFIPAKETLLSLLDKTRISSVIKNMDFSKCTPIVSNRIKEDFRSVFSDLTSDDLAFYNGLVNNNDIIDHLKKDALIIMTHPRELLNEGREIDAHYDHIFRDRVARGELPHNFPFPNHTWEHLYNRIKAFQMLRLDTLGDPQEGFGFSATTSYFGQINRFMKDLHQMMNDKKTVLIITKHSNRLKNILNETNLQTSTFDLHNLNPYTTIIPGSLDEGWTMRYLASSFVIISDKELFGTIKRRRRKIGSPRKMGVSLTDLVTGNYVVHVNHGIAKFTGTKKIRLIDDEREYLVLEYADQDKIYLPTDRLDLISNYIGTRSKDPILTRLNTTEWSRTKEKVKESAQILAKELLDHQAKREVMLGHAFSPDSPWQIEMEDAFPYEETEDQHKTIAEIKSDMENQRPMDRLVCGDVGYGKTEVALRAAFKAVTDGKQVAMLVPTTVLAQQHGQTFNNRLAPYPIRVEVLSRFKSQSDQKSIIEGMRLGSIDIVIGTHRLLQDDVQFKNPGLIIIDEEQRFGVSHKEQIKNIKQGVDILTLSATPIPRTLYMSLTGLKDISTMETPPEDRYPVTTYVGEYTDHIVKQAILRELERGGQVFFIHNRIKTIEQVSRHLTKLTPQARISFGHGRMPEEDLEDVMVKFVNGEHDVLVCTTIIESGLDIPNANTLIIDRADRFGLSQLYQLRGRVGRTGQQAYSYLLIPIDRQITSEAEERLNAIMDASELGSGFQIAMRDLEIRGAGNVLGSQQSGHIHAVGFRLYSQLLNEAIEDLKSNQDDQAPQRTLHRDELRIDLPLAAYIPEDYVSHLPNRITIYQKLSEMLTPTQISDMRDELMDRFGAIPTPVENLFYIVSLKIKAKNMGVKSISYTDDSLIVSIGQSIGGGKLAIQKALGQWAIVGNTRIRLSRASIGEDWQSRLDMTLGILQMLRDRLIGK